MAAAAADAELRDVPEELVRAAEDLKTEEKPSKLSRLIRGAMSSADSAAAYKDEFREDLKDLVRAANDYRMEDKPLVEGHAAERQAIAPIVPAVLFALGMFPVVAGAAGAFDKAKPTDGGFRNLQEE